MADDGFVAADEGYISSDSSLYSLGTLPPPSLPLALPSPSTSANAPYTHPSTSNCPPTHPLSLSHTPLTLPIPFPGDRTDLRTASLAYDTSQYWSRIHTHLPAVIAFRNNQSPPPPAQPAANNHPLYNPYEGQPCARQLAESVDAFLTRLPPQTTQTEKVGPWIYIADPRSGRRVSDEDVAGLRREGRGLLEAFEQARAGVSAEGSGEGRRNKSSRGVVDRKVAPLRDQLQQSLYALAGPHNIPTGKWMLFRSSTSPAEHSIDSTWAAIAHATAAGQLGTAAKIATDDGSRGGSSRLICVYTADFADTGDVRRVLDKLVELGLVDAGGRAKGIFYKADLLTHLDIQSGNEWGIKASLYSSKEMLSKV